MSTSPPSRRRNQRRAGLRARFTPQPGPQTKLPVPVALALCLLLCGCAARAAAGGPQPRRDPAGPPHAAYAVILPADMASAVQVGLPLCRNDVRAGEVSVIVDWRTTGTHCGFHLVPRIASRSGRGRPTTSGEQAGRINPADGTQLLSAGAVANETFSKAYIVVLRRESSAGGEVLTLEFQRDTEHQGDTCETDLVITAVRFEGGTRLANDSIRGLRIGEPGGRLTISGTRVGTLKPR